MVVSMTLGFMHFVFVGLREDLPHQKKKKKTMNMVSCCSKGGVFMYMCTYVSLLLNVCVSVYVLLLAHIYIYIYTYACECTGMHLYKYKHFSALPEKKNESMGHEVDYDTNVL